jgi:hypothetical protein
MCLYTQRIYICWCRDYYVKFQNRCEKALREDKECSFVFGQRCEKENTGLCEYHAEQAELQRAEVVSGEYSCEEGVEGELRRARTSACDGTRNGGTREVVQKRTRRSDPIRSPPRWREVEGDVRDSGELEEARGFVDRREGGEGYVEEDEDDEDEDDEDDDDEFVLAEDLHAHARQPDTIHDLPRFVSEPEELWESVAREVGISMDQPLGESIVRVIMRVVMTRMMMSLWLLRQMVRRELRLGFKGCVP